MNKREEIQENAGIAIGDNLKAGIEVSMRVGKCLIGLKHMKKNLEYGIDGEIISNFLVVAPKKSVYDGWVADAKKFGFEYLLPHITFTTYRSLTKADIEAYVCIYLDECHSLKRSHDLFLAAYVSQGGMLLGLTGTWPSGERSEKAKMCNFWVPKVFQYLTDDAVADGILNDYRIIVHELELSKEKDLVVKGKNGNFTTSELASYTYWAKQEEDAEDPKYLQICAIQKMKTLQRGLTKERYAANLLAEQTDKTILFATTQAQADKLCIHSYHAKNPDSEYNLMAFKKGDIMKMSTVDQLDMGLTVPELKTNLIMHAFANDHKASQRIGRILGLNPDDMGTVHILSYSNSVDKLWVTNALKKFDPSKISWVKAKIYADVCT